LSKEKVAALCYLILEDKLDVKIAIVKNGILHTKIYILKNTHSGDALYGVGSGNLSDAAFVNNYENYSIFTSWDFGKEYMEESDEDPNYEQVFTKTWRGDDPEAEIHKLDKEFAEKLLKKTGVLNRKLLLSPKGEYSTNAINKELIKSLKSSPVLFEFNLGRSSLYPHQVRAVNEALQSWPVRKLFADQVGLGKTLELGSTIQFLIKNESIKSVLIMCPQSLTSQWQDELSFHFNLNFNKYDNQKKAWVDSNGNVTSTHKVSITNYSESFPKFAIISKDTAVRNANEDIFRTTENYPDLLVVDEAHHALRRRLDNGQMQKNNFSTCLEREIKNFNHILLATATPIRKEVNELFFLLQYLGNRKFLSEKEYALSLSGFKELSISSDSSKPSLNTLSLAVDIFKKFLLQCRSKALIIMKLIYSNLKLKMILPMIFMYDNWEEIFNLLIKLHPVNFMVSRNSQKSLENFSNTYRFPERKFVTHDIHTSETTIDFDNFYEESMKYLKKEYQIAHKEIYQKKGRNIQFMQSNFQQRITSSFWSAKKTIEMRKSHIDKQLNMFEQIYNAEGSSLTNLESKKYVSMYIANDIDYLSIDFSSINLDKIIDCLKQEKSALQHLVGLAQNVIEFTPEGLNSDPKINKLLEVLNNLNLNESSVLIFSQYTSTLDEVTKAVIDEFKEDQKFGSDFGYASFRGDIKTIKIKGSALEKNSNKREITYALNNDYLDIVFCSSAAGEGLNLQKADVLINIDVPWVPAELEQRIGRIARLGQKKDSVHIHNIWYPDSIESKIYKKLIERQKNSKLALGDFSEMVSETIDKNFTEFDDETINELIKKINNMRTSEEIEGLEKLWDAKKSQFTIGELVRKQLIEIGEKYNLSDESFDFKAGSENPINFNSEEFETFINLIKFKKNNSSDLKYYSIQFEDGTFIGLAQQINEDFYLVSPSDYLTLFDSLIQENEAGIKVEKILNHNYLEIVNAYKKLGYNSIIPNFNSFNFGSLNEKYIKGLKFEFLFSN
jgi:SNF2 family DNA or RNA helicase